MKQGHNQQRQRLSELLRGQVDVTAADDCALGGLAVDSRHVKAGDLFIACVGTRDHGHRFINEALRAGAAAVIYDNAVQPQIEAAHGGATVIGVDNLTRRIGETASRFYGHPSREMLTVGVTGTNGKTSCAHYLAQALSHDGAPCGMIGTLGYGAYGRLTPGGLTTPDAVTVQRLLAGMRDAGSRNVVIEASSHGLAQGRLNGVAFDAAVFTNLTRDHLDYHTDMEDYGQAKTRLFTTPGLRYAIVNGDDAYSAELLSVLPRGVEPLIYYLEDGGDSAAQTTQGAVEIRGCRLRFDNRGLQMDLETPWGSGTLCTPLLGGFNARNILAVAGVLLMTGMSLEEVLRRLGGVEPVPGRMEVFGLGAGQMVVVDYAHTPDALQQALLALRAHVSGELWCVFGCGGERDTGKRPLMGEIAQYFADRVVITDDNPRGEDPQTITEQILKGMNDTGKAVVIHDRAAAISYAIGHADDHDAILIAGKGHEDYQIVGKETRPFSDREQVRAFLTEVA